MTKSRLNLDLVPVVVSVLIALVAFSAAISQYPRLPILGDPVHYHMTAQRILASRTYAYGGENPSVKVPPNAVVTPGYPTYLAAVYAASELRSDDASASALRVQPVLANTQLMLALCTVALIALSGLLMGGRVLSGLSGVMAAVYVPFAWGSSVALGETLSATLAAAQLALALWMTSRKSRPPVVAYGLFGVLSAALAMLRPIMLVWIVVPIAYLALRRIESPRRLLILSSWILAGVALVIVPWTVRNAVVLDRFVPLAENSGTVLFLATGGGELSSDEQAVFDSSADEGGDGFAAVGRYRLRTAFKEDPRGFVVSRFATIWESLSHPWSAVADVYWALANTPDIVQISEGPVSPPGESFNGWMSFETRYHLLLLTLSVLALGLVPRSPRIAVAVSVPLYVIAMHSFTLFIDRYFFPAMPAVIVAAACVLYWAFRKTAKALPSLRNS